MSDDLQDIVNDFAAKWNLDDRSMDLLLRQSGDVLEEVMRVFDPPPDTRNPNAKLVSLIRKLAGAMPAGDAHQAPRAAPRAPSRGTVADDGYISDLIRDFSDQWGLDERSQELLRGLEPEVCEGVIRDFAPAEDTQNISAKLASFVRVRHQHISQQAGDDVTTFAELWGLDEECEAMLRMLAPHQQSEVIMEFNPGPETRNVSGKLVSFIRAVQNGGGGSKGACKGKGSGKASVGKFAPRAAAEASIGGSAPKASPTKRPSLLRQTEDPVAEFIDRWQLDSGAEEAFRRQPDHIQDAVLAEFDPPPGTRNASGKLIAFLKVKTGGGAGARAYQDPLTAFAAHWRIDADAQQALGRLPQGLQQNIMAEFNPPPGTLNASGKLIAFIKTKTSDGGGRGFKRPRDPVSDFVMHWAIDAEADQLLRSLPMDVQHGVIADFHPPSGTMNFSGKLCSFIRTRMNGSAGGPPQQRAPHSALLARRALPSRPPSRPASKGSARGGGGGDEISDFVQQWGLDQDSEALIRSCSEAVQAAVLSDFQPQQGTRNPNAKLVMWIKKMRQEEGPASKRPRIG